MRTKIFMKLFLLPEFQSTIIYDKNIIFPWGKTFIDNKILYGPVVSEGMTVSKLVTNSPMPVFI